MPREIPVDLTKTGGSLTAGLPGLAGMAGPKASPAPADGPSVTKPTDPKPAAPPPTPEAPPQPKCNQCGLDPTRSLDHCTQTDEAEFMRAVLRGLPFTREYTLFGGAVRVAFRDLTPQEAADIGSVLDKEEAGGKFPMTMTGAALRFDRSISLCLGTAVESLTIGDPHAVPAHADHDAAHAWVVDRCKTEAVYRAVRGAYLKFSNVLAAVSKKALDPSFSKATAGGGG